jgi:integrase
VNPLASVQKVETRGREVRNRRALTHDEFLILLGVSGPDRSVVYAVAYYTGLRRNELVSLCWSDFDLTPDASSVKIHAKHAKNKQSV